MDIFGWRLIRAKEADEAIQHVMDYYRNIKWSGTFYGYLRESAMVPFFEIKRIARCLGCKADWAKDGQ